MRIDPEDKRLKWLVEAFQETELPKPWTCYKGVGSIVCYIRADNTGQVTWQHPFYSYFRQLRDFCKEAQPEEVLRVRVNRLLWSYEASRVETEHDQEPLLSPFYIQRLGDIFSYNVKTQGFMVRNLKAQLKVFAKSYRERQEIDMGDVNQCMAVLAKDVEKDEEMHNTWERDAKVEMHFDLKALADGGLKCVNCNQTALCFCLECKDYLCLNCYDQLHNKGARRDHAPFRLVRCTNCNDLPAKLHCNFTDKSLCNKCYAMVHIKLLPLDGKENQPRRIDYKQQYSRYAEFARQRAAAANPYGQSEDAQSYESVLTNDWHPFYDCRGVKYYHNFVTGERMRQSPRRVPNTADPGAVVDAEDTLAFGSSKPSGFDNIANTTDSFNKTFNPNASPDMMATKDSFRSGRLGNTGPLALSGFDSLDTGDPAAVQYGGHLEKWVILNSDLQTHAEAKKVVDFFELALKDPNCPMEAKNMMNDCVMMGVPPVGTNFELNVPVSLVTYMQGHQIKNIGKLQPTITQRPGDGVLPALRPPYRKNMPIQD